MKFKELSSYKNRINKADAHHVNIKLLGVGGLGCSFVKYYLDNHCSWSMSSIYAVDSDLDGLLKSMSPYKIQLGESIANGLSTNGDINFAKKSIIESIDTFENDDIDNFLLFSYLHNDEKLKYNFKEFGDDFDIGTVDDNKPLEKLEYYVKRYNPKAILIDGIDFKYIEENFEKIFIVIKKMLSFKIKHNFGIVNISQKEQDKFISRMNKFMI